jgi:hypothetical protein
MANYIELFPQRQNVGENALTGWKFPEALAKRMVKTGLWGYTPKISTESDVQLMVDRAKSEIQSDARALEQERLKLEQERAELEQLRAELQASKKQKTIKTEI